MSKVEMSTDVRSLLDFYREEHRIYGRCPHCHEVFRLSEAKLTYGKEPPRDILTQLKKERDRLSEQVEDQQAMFDEVQQGHETELQLLNGKWEAKLGTEVDRRVEKEKKQIRRDAIERSRVTTLGKTLERIAPMFSGFGFHPGDVRALYDPIDFVIFDGLWSKDVTEVVFVEFKTGGSPLSPVQRSVRDAVNRKRVRFEERRISRQTLRRIVSRPVRERVIIEGNMGV